jgi:hypothetical protein
MRMPNGDLQVHFRKTELRKLYADYELELL